MQFDQVAKDVAGLEDSLREIWGARSRLSVWRWLLLDLVALVYLAYWAFGAAALVLVRHKRTG